MKKKEEALYRHFEEIISEHFKQKKYDLVLNDFRALFHIKGFDTKFKYFALARTSYSFFKNTSEYKNYWLSLSNPCMLKAYYIANSLISHEKSSKDLTNDFTKLVDLLFDDTIVKNNFIDSFKILADAYESSEKISDIQTNNLLSHDKVLVVSGSGWSGSSAVLDYLREFSNVAPVLGEVGIIEEDLGFKYFIKSINNKNKIFEHAIKFFFVNLIGCYAVECISFYKPMLSSYKILNNCKNLIDYSLQVKSIAPLLADIIIETQQENYSVDNMKLILKDLGKKLLDLITLDVPVDKIPVLDNSIHIQNIDLLNYISDVKVICSFRDPRAIYISMLEERPGFIRDPLNFIREQSNIRKNIESTFTCLEKNSQGNLLILNFEDFVLSKECRENLVSKLGISLNNWNSPEKYFKPEISSKNVRNFINYSDSDTNNDIAIIEKELKQYCYK